MENIHSTNHSWLRHEWQTVNCPRNASDFCVHLDEDFADDRAKILAFLDCAYENYLRWDGEFCKKELFDIVVERAFAFLTRQK